MRNLAILLMLVLAVALGAMGLLSTSWLVLVPGLIVGALLHWMIWSEDIRSDWRKRRRRPVLMLLGRDLLGLAAAFAIGRLIGRLVMG